MTLVLLAAVLMASIAAPVSAQQPAPAPPPVETRERPEAEASRDLERMGETQTRKDACGRLTFALHTVREDGNDLSRSNSDRIQQLRDAVRYYARAHGLTTNVDELMDDLDLQRAALSDPQRQLPAEEKRSEAEKRWGKCHAYFWTAVAKLQERKALEAAAPAPPRPVSAADPTRDKSLEAWAACRSCHPVGLADPAPDKGGLSKNAKIGAGVGAVLVGVGVLAAGGGSDASASTPAAPAPPLTPFNPAGPYDVTLTVLSDPGGNAPRIAMEPSLALNFTVAGSTLQYTCPVGSHINPGGGPIDLITGAFNAAGSGPFAGRNGVQFLFPGTFGRDGTITGEYRVGTAGELGQVTTYGLNGRKRQ
jgi:hypothetical protein